MSLLLRLGLVVLALPLAACFDSNTTEVYEPGVAPEPTATEQTGTLSSSDETLQSGEYVDTYDVLVRDGQWLSIELLSTDFDPYLIVRSPTGTQTDVDDSQKDNFSLSKSILEATESGKWTIAVTTYEVGEAGTYTLIYEVLDEKPTDAREGRQIKSDAAEGETPAVTT